MLGQLLQQLNKKMQAGTQQAFPVMYVKQSTEKTVEISDVEPVIQHQHTLLHGIQCFKTEVFFLLQLLRVTPDPRLQLMTFADAVQHRHNQFQILPFHILGDKVIGTGPHGGKHQLHILRRCHQHQRHIDVPCAHLGQQFNTIHFRHVVIGKHHIKHGMTHRIQRRSTVLNTSNGKACLG
tara:strand:- start:123818 stop:124357 length:540 start_codon:yes stop_codon:yes gene_type:complete